MYNDSSLLSSVRLDHGSDGGDNSHGANSRGEGPGPAPTGDVDTDTAAARAARVAAGAAATATTATLQVLGHVRGDRVTALV